MIRRTLLLLLLCNLAIPCSAEENNYQLKKVDKLPANTPKHLEKLLNPKGYALSTAKGVTMRLWVLKEIPAKPNFKASASVKYPFALGQLIGLIQVEQGQKISDFRQQEIGTGLYPIRYGAMPEDGNHIGASELFDFLLALPLSKDKSIKPISDLETLSSKSAEAAESAHPAIFSLLPPQQGAKDSLQHDTDLDFWILNFSATVNQKGKSIKLPLRLVVVGFSEA